MGLDSVELLIDIEDEFGIEFSNLEAEQIQTIGDFYETIVEKLNLNKSEENKLIRKCKSQQVFYRIRKAIARRLNLPIKSISPESRLDTLFSEKDRIENWNSITPEIGLKTPELRRPKYIEYSINIIGIGLIFLIIALGMFENLELLTLLSLVPIYWMICYRLTKNMAIHFDSESMKDLVEETLGLNYDTLDLSKVNREEVMWILKGVVNRKIGVPIPEIKYESRITTDLGID